MEFQDKMNLTTIEILESPRQVTADWHLSHARDLLVFDNGRMLDNVLIYCALDLRLAIERFAFELLVMAYDFNLNPLTEKQINKASRDVFKLIEKDFPNLEKHLQFLNLVMETMNQPIRSAIIDFAWLKKMRGNLSDICHLQLRPDPKTEFLNEMFKNNGFSLFKEIIDKFTEWLRFPSAWAPIEKMPIEIQDLQKRFLAGEINNEEVRVNLLIMQPILQRRFELKMSR